MYCTQQTSFQRQTPLYDDVIDHPNTCMCIVYKYPWHTPNDIILVNKGPKTMQIYTQFTRKVYNNYLRRLTRGKTLEPNNIPNDIIKALSP